METFLHFLVKAKESLSNLTPLKSIHLVIGNMSCDLDSTVSALSYAFLKYSENNQTSEVSAVIPIMNVNSNLFPLRTEICFLLKNVGIDTNNLIFKDQIDYASILKVANVETTLVDHHVLDENDRILARTVVQIFDHRPINNEDICRNPGLNQTISLVGSCATLISKEILDHYPSILFQELGQLLYATIIYDTIGLDSEFGRTFDDDVAVAERLEQIIKPSQSRKDLFSALWKVHNDTSSLTAKDLLHRDLKIVRIVPIPGLPMLVEDYLKREDSYAAIQAFAEECNAHTVVLIGIDASEKVRRDIGLFSSSTELGNILIELLKNSKQATGSDLLLSEIATKTSNITCFRQGNIKLTRKFIVPLVAEAVSNFLNKT